MIIRFPYSRPVCAPQNFAALIRIDGRLGLSSVPDLMLAVAGFAEKLQLCGMDISKILQRLEAQCARREYCSSDVYSKALKALGPEGAEAASQVVESLRENGFVDDRRYAAAFAREKASLTGWGPVKIRLALKAKKISGSVIEEALGEIDDSKACEKLQRLLESKARTLEGDPQKRLKLLRFALGRGYEYDDVEKVLKKCE